MKAAAQRYASVLADIALEQGAAEPVKKSLSEFAGLVEQSADLRNFLASPAVARSAKQAVIEKIAARIGASKIVRNFLLVLSDNRRPALLREIVAAFDAVVLERRGVAEAQVTSAVDLSEAQKKELTAALERMTGKKVQARYTADPALMGGAVVRIGSTIYDGSVRAQLNRLRDRLASE